MAGHSGMCVAGPSLYQVPTAPWVGDNDRILQGGCSTGGSVLRTLAQGGSRSLCLKVGWARLSPRLRSGVGWGGVCGVCTCVCSVCVYVCVTCVYMLCVYLCGVCEHLYVYVSV